MVSVIGELRRRGRPDVRVVLTDKFPNFQALRAAVRRCPDGVQMVDFPVDARQVPSDLVGFRTLFTSFHHFSPPAAREILEDAVRQRQGIGIFEYTERNFLIWGLPLLVTPAFVWLVTPLLRPLTWQRCLWTYLLPVVPVAATFDGVVSCLRTYSPKELRDLVASLTACGYHWDIGRIRSFGACRITYLLGWPTGIPAE